MSRLPRRDRSTYLRCVIKNKSMVVILIIGITFDVIGTILIAYTVLRVHNRAREERAIDSRVINEMKKERATSIVGIVFIIIGYIFQVFGLLA